MPYACSAVTRTTPHPLCHTQVLLRQRRQLLDAVLPLGRARLQQHRLPGAPCLPGAARPDAGKAGARGSGAVFRPRSHMPPSFGRVGPMLQTSPTRLTRLRSRPAHFAQLAGPSAFLDVVSETKDVFAYALADSATGKLAYIIAWRCGQHSTGPPCGLARTQPCCHRRLSHACKGPSSSLSLALLPHSTQARQCRRGAERRLARHGDADQQPAFFSTAPTGVCLGPRQLEEHTCRRVHTRWHPALIHS